MNIYLILGYLLLKKVQYAAKRSAFWC